MAFTGVFLIPRRLHKKQKTIFFISGYGPFYSIRTGSGVAGYLDGEMKFYIAEGNIGGNATKEQVEVLIKLLKQKGWDVEYGIARNIATDISEFGQEQRLQSLFADDFMACLSEIENE